MEQYNILEWDKKLKIQKIFSIKPSAQREMVNNKMKFDGVILQDLEAVNIGNMIEALGDNWNKGVIDWDIQNLCDQLWELLRVKISEETKIEREYKKEDIKVEEKEIKEKEDKKKGIFK